MPRWRDTLLATSSLVGAFGLFGVAPAQAQPPACTTSQLSTSGSSVTINLMGTSCTLPTIAYPTATNSAATTVTNSGPAAQLYLGAAGTTSTYAGSIVDGAGATGLVFQGGTLTIAPSGSNKNTNSGTTEIQAGTIYVGATNALSVNAPVLIDTTGTLDLGGYTQTLTSVVLNGGTIQNGTLTGPVESLGGAVNGIGGPARLSVNAGTTTVTGTDTYTGVTLIAATTTPGTLTVTSTGEISGSSALTVNAGTFNDAGSATFTGASTIAAAGTAFVTGSLEAGPLVNAGTLDASQGTLNVNGSVTNNGTLTLGNSFGIIGNLTNNGTVNIPAIFDPGNYVITNNAGAVWNGDLTFQSGSVAVNAGTIITQSSGLSNAGTFTTTGVLDVTNGGLNNSGTTVASGMIIGAVTNSGTFTATGTLTGITSFTGQGGTLDISGTAAGLSVGTLAGTGQVTLGAQTLTITAGSTTYAGSISGTGGLAVTGGTETLSGQNNTYTGATTITGGTLLGAGNSVISPTSAIVLGSGGTLDLGGYANLLQSVSLQGGTLQNGAVRGPVQGAFSLLTNDPVAITSSGGTINGISGSAVLTTTGGTTILLGNNTFTGGSSLTTPSSVSIQINGGTLQIGNGGTSGTFAANIGNAGALVFDRSDASTFAGSISGTGTVTQIGAGTLTLSGANSYTGATTVTAGGLAVASTGSITQSSGLTVSAGTFANAGTATFLGTATVATGATLTNTGTMAVGTLNNAGTVNFNGPTFNITNGINNSGTLNHNGGSFFISGNGGNGFFNNTGTANVNLINGLNANGTGIIINNNAGGTINGNLTANKNVTNNNANATWNGDLTIASGAAVANAGTWTAANAGLSNAGTFTTTGTFDATKGGVTNTGMLTASGSLIGAVTNTGTFNVIGPLTGITTFAQQAGTLDLGGTTLALTSLALTGGTVQNGSINGSITASGGTISAIGGTASLTTTAGTTIALGANTYSGGTTISGGTLQVGNGGTGASITGPVMDNGALVFNHSDNSIFTGLVSGTGSLTQSGGTLALTANESYTGATTVTAGNLFVGVGGTTGAIAGNISLGTGTSLLFDRADSVTYAGGISGSGAIAQLGGLVLTSATGSTSGITQTGTGTLTLTGANTFTGGALVANGTLDVEGSLVSSVVVGGIGPGTSITTSNGVFQVGQNTSSTNYGAILAGAGSVGSVSVASGGMVMPGSPAARTALAAGTPTTAGTTLTVAGNLALSSGSTLAIFASPTQNTSLAVTGAATIGGALTVMTSGTIAGGTKDAIITAAGGISGAFTSLTINGAQGQLSSLSTSGNTEYVTFGSSAPVVVATPPATAVAQVVAAAATTPNTSSVGTSLALNPNSTLGKAVATLTPAQATNVLNSLSGEGNVSSQTAGQGATRTFTNFIGDRSAPGESNNNSGTVQVSGGGLPAGVSQYAPVEPQVVAIVVDKPKPTPLYRVFATGFGGFNNTAAQGATTAAENGSFYGGLMGIDYRVQPNVLIGAAAGGSTTNFQVPARSSSGTTTGFNGNVFAVVSFGPWYGQSLTTLSTFSNTTTRNIAGFGSGANAVASAIEQASFGSFEVRTRAEFGRVTPIPNTIKGFETFKVTPFVALELAQLKTDGYSEYNASGGPNTDGLTAASRTYADVRSFLGARLETSYDAGNGITLRPIARLSYVHAFSPAPTSINSFQSVPGATFTVSGAPVAHNSAETKVGAEADLGHGTVIFVNFEGNFSTVEQIYGGRGGIRYSW